MRRLKPNLPSHRDVILMLIFGFFGLGLARADVVVENPTSQATLRFSDGTVGTLEQTRVTMEITGILARVKVRQVIRNPRSTHADGQYRFPLPPDTAVNSMVLEVDGRTIVGEVQERAAAARSYAAARDSGRRAALVAASGNWFQTEVSNIPPGDVMSIELSYLETLSFDDGVLSIRLPNSVLLSDDTTIDVDLDPGFELARLESSYHQIVTTNRNRSREISLDGPIGNHDFELVWEPLVTDQPQAAFFLEPGADVDYGLVMWMPPAAEFASTQSRELILVIDRSGSMHGEAMTQARESLIMALGSLKPTDSFNVVAFNHEARPLFDRAQPADNHAIGTALEFIDELTADGGTVLDTAWEMATETAIPAGALRQIVFITDGAVANQQQLFAAITERLGEARLFTVGIGPAPDSRFMERAARFGRGHFTHIGSADQVAERMDRLLRQLEYPALTDLCLEWPGVADVFPSRLPDLYAGVPLTAVARFDRTGSGKATVCGKREHQLWTRDFDLAAARTSDAISSLWAQNKVGDLMDQMTLGGDPGLLRAEIVDLGLAHQLLTAYTSFVAIDDAIVAPDRSAEIGLPQTDAATVARVTMGLLLLLLGFLFRRLMRE